MELMGKDPVRDGTKSTEMTDLFLSIILNENLLKSFYTLIPRLIKPTIRPGETIEIEIYISGYGEVEKNKFSMFYSSRLVNQSDVGKIEYNIGFATSQTTGETKVVANNQQSYHSAKLGPVGMTIGLNQGYFCDHPNLGSGSPNNFPPIMSEVESDGMPPFRIKMNTSTKGIAGDYDIDFALTYMKGDEIKTDHKTVTIHVTRWLERNEKKATILGIVSGWLSVILAIVLKP